MKKLIKERNAAFESDDFDWARRTINNSHPEVVEAGFHKARYECVDVSDAKRLESQKWLADRKLKRLLGGVVQHGDPLPGSDQ